MAENNSEQRRRSATVVPDAQRAQEIATILSGGGLQDAAAGAPAQPTDAQSQAMQTAATQPGAAPTVQRVSLGDSIAQVPNAEQLDLPTSPSSLGVPQSESPSPTARMLEDPRTILATVFGLAALNSDADNIAGAFLEGMGAMGSAVTAQRTREQRTFENEAQQARIQNERQQVETQQFTAEQAAEADQRNSALQKYGIDSRNMTAAAQQDLLRRGQDIERETAGDTHRRQIFLGMLRASTDLEGYNQATQQAQDQSRAIMMKSVGELYREELFSEKPRAFNQFVNDLAKQFPWMQDHVTMLEEGRQAAAQQATAAPVQLSAPVLREGIEMLATQKGQASRAGGYTQWKDPEVGKNLQNLSQTELQQVFDSMNTKGLTYLPGPGWLFNAPETKNSGNIDVVRQGLGLKGPTEAIAAPTKNPTTEKEFREAYSAAKPGEIITFQGKRYSKPEPME